MDMKIIQEILKDEPAFRIKQVYRAVFVNLIEKWSEASELSLKLRELLEKECPLEMKVMEEWSHDGKTVKAAIDHDGDVVEAVLMRHKERNTICVSSQVGCPLKCAFCATGKAGFARNLSAHEIVDQVLHFARLLKKENENVSNIVFMGMGEPFLNYDEVMKAIKILNDKEGFNIGVRKISISTAGVIDGIKRLTTEKMQVNLAVSLHAPNDFLRNEIMPINKNYPIKSLLKAVGDYIKKTNRKVVIEYLMLDDVNDTEDHAKELSEILKKNLGSLFCVNLIAYNATDRFRSSSKEKIKIFKDILKKNEIEVIERYRFGTDIKAACGQLAGQSGFVK
jgi:23S rRNA (adenine2503-C2)-methyltransferase